MQRHSRNVLAGHATFQPVFAAAKHAVAAPNNRNAGAVDTRPLHTRAAHLREQLATAANNIFNC